MLVPFFFFFYFILMRVSYPIGLITGTAHTRTHHLGKVELGNRTQDLTLWCLNMGPFKTIFDRIIEWASPIEVSRNKTKLNSTNAKVFEMSLAMAIYTTAYELQRGPCMIWVQVSGKPSRIQSA